MKYEIKIAKRDKTQSCKGLYYRAVLNCFISKKGHFINSIEMRLLKKKSCSGCEVCISMLDISGEIFHEMMEGFSPEKNKIYTLIMGCTGYNREEGYYEYEPEWRLAK
jgi:hypothetical protein